MPSRHRTAVHGILMLFDLNEPTPPRAWPSLQNIKNTSILLELLKTLIRSVPCVTRGFKLLEIITEQIA